MPGRFSILGSVPRPSGWPRERPRSCGRCSPSTTWSGCPSPSSAAGSSADTCRTCWSSSCCSRARCRSWSRCSSCTSGWSTSSAGYGGGHLVRGVPPAPVRGPRPLELDHHDAGQVGPRRARRSRRRPPAGPTRPPPTDRPARCRPCAAGVPAAAARGERGSRRHRPRRTVRRPGSARPPAPLPEDRIWPPARWSWWPGADAVRRVVPGSCGLDVDLVTVVRS